MDLIDDYIQSFLKGTLSAEERLLLKQWVRRDREHQAYFQQAVSVWKATAILSNESHYDVEAAICRFQKETQIRSTLFYKQTLRVASVAACLLLGGLASFFFLKENSKEKENVDACREYVVEVPAGAKSKVTFPDGSMVWLNSESVIKYTSDFAKQERNVTLIGEGYFEVSKNEALPFVVHTEKLSVKVLGTKFNLKSYSEDESVKVVLKEGAVEVGDLLADSKPICLSPNQRLTYQKSDQQIQVDSIDASHIEEWRHGVMFFEQESLQQITKELSRLYDVKIQIDNKQLNDIVYYSDFPEDIPLERVLEILSYGDKFKYEMKSELIRIYKYN